MDTEVESGEGQGRLRLDQRHVLVAAPGTFPRAAAGHESTSSLPVQLAPFEPGRDFLLVRDRGAEVAQQSFAPDPARIWFKVGGRAIASQLVESAGWDEQSSPAVAWLRLESPVGELDQSGALEVVAEIDGDQLSRPAPEAWSTLRGRSWTS